MSAFNDWFQDTWMGGMFNGMFTRPDGFTPLYGYSMIERKTPVVVDVSYGKLWNVYTQSPYLRIVIDRGAEMFGNADVKIIGADGKEIPEHPVLTLLRNPTPLHSLEEWLRWIWVMDSVYANTFLYSLGAFSSSLPAAIWTLPSWDMKLVPTGKIWKQTKLEDIIQYYESISNPDERYEPSTILHLVTGISQNPLVGQSAIPSLQLHISNGNAALTSRNINLVEMGPKGIISGAAKDADGAIPLGKKAKEKLEEQWTNGYGIKKGQGRVKIVETPVTWTPISFPTGEMQMFEETEDDFCAICGKYNMPRHLFPSVKGATFENAKQAERGCYQSTMQPRADSLGKKLTKYFGRFLPPGASIQFDYSWLPVMQEDEGQRQAARKSKADTNAVLLFNGIINREAFAVDMGVEMTGGAKDSTADQLGKIPIALQQVALARERANTAGDTALANALGTLMDQLTAQMAAIGSVSV